MGPALPAVVALLTASAGRAVVGGASRPRTGVSESDGPSDDDPAQSDSCQPAHRQSHMCPRPVRALGGIGIRGDPTVSPT